MYYHVPIKMMLSRNMYYIKNVHIILCEKKQNKKLRRKYESIICSKRKYYFIQLLSEF